ncbi:MAG: hypothetical protein KDD63_03015 [Bacteroidetes bacterium]|nr:hypothetical protein [Bacteroidota bacterium]MCB0842976.1 hypothetical protein [Bacteroidota bacterium]MCB0851188.1 hypothetical protein [Bacteroidota bacterium]
MNAFAKILTILVFIGFGLSLYAGSKAGWGVSGLRDQATIDQIKKNCPEYYQNKNGDCLRSTFRSYFLIYGSRGGGFGSGK